MARKQKAAPTLRADTPPSSVASPAAPSAKTRRSSRRISSKPEYAETGTEDEDAVDTPNGGDNMLKDAAQLSITGRARPMLRRKSSALKRDIRALGELDDKLHGHSKRQRNMIDGGGRTPDAGKDGKQGSGAEGIIPAKLSRASAPRRDSPSVRKRTKEHVSLPNVPRDISGGEETEAGDDAYAPIDDDLMVGDRTCLEVSERGAARPPAVNSSYLPLPWKGRLGYACLNTYLRAAKPSVFCSRTCRMASIVDHRHPLQDPSQPEHATKNRPDKAQDADVARGQRYVHELGLTNARDLVKMLRWNDKYGIKFMRLSSEMFPFASHPEHGYRLAPFASEVLAEAGRVVAELGHRVTMHPGQFTQLGSPRKEVIAGSVRDLEYHDELLSLLKLPEQQDRDAVMIIHMGGVFGDKAATLARFRKHYTDLLSPSIKARLVLENDDVSWSVHDLLPVCEQLDIPLVLDFHHHNIVFDATQLREGTHDVSQPELMDRILATWRRKGIRPKMHYSEQCAGAVTARDRRKHSPRVMTLPPCPPDMDLMIEAKDKEQAVFELMRTFKLPGFEMINDMIPHEREDEDKPPAKILKGKDGGKRKTKAPAKKVTGADADGVEDEVVQMDVELDGQDTGRTVSAEEFGMGGPLNRVYWPLGMEHWLKPKKREQNKTMKADLEEE